MSPAQVDLARELVALPGWDTLPGYLRVGMAIDDGGRRLRVIAHEGAGAVAGLGARVTLQGGLAQAPTWLDDLPDLTDAATGGVLLGMLPSAYEVDHDERGCRVRARDSKGDLVPGRQDPWSSTLAEAAARALVALGRCS